MKPDVEDIRLQMAEQFSTQVRMLYDIKVCLNYIGASVPFWAMVIIFAIRINGIEEFIGTMIGASIVAASVFFYIWRFRNARRKQKFSNT